MARRIAVKSGFASGWLESQGAARFQPPFFKLREAPLLRRKVALSRMVKTAVERSGATQANTLLNA